MNFERHEDPKKKMKRKFPICLIKYHFELPVEGEGILPTYPMILRISKRLARLYVSGQSGPAFKATNLL
jgi:hypothetical protein